jgi:hypothetical protein
VTTAANLFNPLTSLQSVDLSGFAGKSVTAVNALFESCRALVKVDLSPFQNAPIQNAGSLLSNCLSLIDVDVSPICNSQLSTAISMFYNCSSMVGLTAPVPVSFSVVNLKLSAAALDALYTSLPTVTGKTIYVKGNYGISGHDPTIATAKGWTVDTTT